MQVDITPFFVIAPPKTGSTLLTRMICQHPDVTSMRESWALFPDRADSIANPGSDKAGIHRVSNKQAKRWRAQIRKGTAQSFREAMSDMMLHMWRKTGATVVGDSWPFYFEHLGMLTEAFPEARLIYAVRDPRSVYCSKHTKGRAGDPEERLRMILQADESVAPLIEQESCFAVAYEMLVMHPEFVMDRVWSYLGVDPKRGWLEYDESKDPMPRRWSWIPEATKPLDSSGLERWKHELDPGKALEITNRALTYCQRWNYPRINRDDKKESKLGRFIGGASLDEIGEDEGWARHELSRLANAINVAMDDLHKVAKAHEARSMSVFGDVYQGSEFWRGYDLGEATGRFYGSLSSDMIHKRVAQECFRGGKRMGQTSQEHDSDEAA